MKQTVPSVTLKYKTGIVEFYESHVEFKPTKGRRKLFTYDEIETFMNAIYKLNELPR